MANVLLWLNKTAFARLRDAQGYPPALGSKVSLFRWDDPSAALEALGKQGTAYLLHERGDGALWLVAVLPGLRRDKAGWNARVMNTTPVVNVDDIRAPLALGSRRSGVRALDEREAEIMDGVRIDGLRARDHVVSVRESLLEAAPTPPAARKRPRLPKLVGELGAACLTQIEAELDGLRAKPDRYLKRRGAFVADVQSIYEGALDAKQWRQLLEGDLAPFAGGGRKRDEVVKHAVDELCRGIVALALGRARDVPASCATLKRPLEKYAAYVSKILGEE